MDEKVVKNFIDSFLKMCDFIEESNEIGCTKCPLRNDCFYGAKHMGLSELMKELGIERK